MITDENGNPLKSDQSEETQPDGEDRVGKISEQDVRTIPTGTLIYNLGKIAGREDGCMGRIEELEMIKAHQKMVQDPEELAMLKHHLPLLEHTRYVIASELNIRFKALDDALAKERGIEIFEPGSLAQEPS